jgi:hypothetical protein
LVESEDVELQKRGRKMRKNDQSFELFILCITENFYYKVETEVELDWGRKEKKFGSNGFLILYSKLMILRIKELKLYMRK